MTKTKQIKIHKQTLLGLLVLFVFPVFAQQNPDVRYHKFFEQYISGYTLTILDSFAYVHARLPTNQFTSVFTKIHINGTVEKDFVPFSDNFPIHFSAFWETTQVLSDSNILFSGLREGLPFVQYLYKVSPDLDSVWHWEKRSDTVRGIIRFVHPYKEFFLVLGDEQHFPSYDVNIYLRKFTNDGELLWQVDIYPPGPAISDTSHQMVQTRSLLTISENEFLISGVYWRSNIQNSSRGFLASIDTLGNINWWHDFENWSDNQEFTTSMVNIKYLGKDSSLIAATVSSRHEFDNVRKLTIRISRTYFFNRQGQITDTLHYSNYKVMGGIGGVIPIDDGLIIYGSFLNHAPSRLSNFDTHHYIPFIAKINMNREIEWWQHLKAWDNPEERIEFFEIVKIKDGFLGSGFAYRKNRVEMWMIRLDSNGCLTDEFCELPPPPPDKAEFLIYPNPSEWGDFFLRVPENTKGEVQIIALDGRIVDTFSLDGTSTIYERHLVHLSRAGYLVRVINGRENVWVGKWFR